MDTKTAMKQWIEENLLPYMTRGRRNKRWSAYYLKHVVEENIGQYVSMEEVQATLADYGFPVDKYYPIREEFFRRYPL